MTRAANGRRSLIAGVNAWFRAVETARIAGGADDRILEDGWAGLLADRDPRIAVIRALAVVVPPLKRVVDELLLAHCVRHRAIDELVLRAVGHDGFRQVVVVGAGYDMRPSRFANHLTGVKWLELDDAGTQMRKRRLLGRHDIPSAKAVAHGIVELEHDRLTPALRHAGFDVTAPICFVMEGLVHYLTPAAFGALQEDIASLPARIRIVFSFIEPDMRRSATPLLMSLFGAMQEIPRSFQTVQSAAAQLSELGFTAFNTWSFPEQVRDFVPAAALSSRRRVPRWWQVVARADRG